MSILTSRSPEALEFLQLVLDNANLNNTLEVHLHFRPDDVVTVTVEVAVPTLAMHKLNKILETYHLMKLKKDQA